jgi:hypothetical protein
MAKAYRTVSHEALCLLTGTMPIDLKIEQTVKIYQITKGNDTGKHSLIKIWRSDTGNTRRKRA